MQFLCIWNGCFYCVSLWKCCRSNLKFFTCRKSWENLCQLYFPAFFRPLKTKKKYFYIFQSVNFHQMHTMPNLYKIFWTVSIIGGGPGLFCPHFRLVAVFCHFCWHCAHVRRKIWKTSTFEFMAGDILHQYCWFILDVGGFGSLHLFGTYLIMYFFSLTFTLHY